MGSKIVIEGGRNLEGYELERIVRKLIDIEDESSAPYLQGNQALVIELVDTV